MPEFAKKKEWKVTAQCLLLNTKRAWLDAASSPPLKRQSKLQKHTQFRGRDSRERHLTVVVVRFHALRGKRARTDGSLNRAGHPKKELNA